MTTLTGRRHSDKGAQLIELAIVTPLLVVVAAGIAESGLFFRCVQVTQNAAREGARLAAIPGSDQNNYAIVGVRVAEYITQSGLTGAVTTATSTVAIPIGPGLNANGVQVVVTYTYNCLFLGPALGLINGTFVPTMTYQTGAQMRTQIAAVAP
jgi:Flp pilus assembly protein TadG